MRSLPAVVTALGVLLLSGCGGGGSTGPSGVPQSVTPDGSTVGFESGTIWATYQRGSTTVFSTRANGSVTATHTYGPFAWPTDTGAIPGGVDVAAAPDGTGWILLSHWQADIQASHDWMLSAIAPNERDPGRPENTYTGVGRPLAFGLGGDGVLVESIGDATNSLGPAVIRTYPYASNTSIPMRTFTVPQADLQFAGFVFGQNSRIYLARPNGFEYYLAESDGSQPLKQIVTDVPPLNTRGSFAVGYDNSIYEVQLVNAQGATLSDTVGAVSLYVNVYPPGSGTASRRIGPIAVHFTGEDFPPIITVDAKNRLYVVTGGNIYQFAANANGNATPLRTVTPPSSGGRVAGIAIGP